ncbi:MAG: hypothetical protein H6736_25310 [Alphaproteobacteria bacterium]|nr:hypothetical protein [Alphaproteobacteria bacterium]
MLYRHAQPLFLSSEPSARTVTGPRMSVRPLDTDAPDHVLSFLVWAALAVRAPTAPAAPEPPKDPKAPDVIVVTGTPAPAGNPKLILEVSADGEGWFVQSEMSPRDRPYLVTVPQMLRYVRMRLEPDGAEARAYGLVLANGPFQLDGPSHIVAPGGREPTPKPEPTR